MKKTTLSYLCAFLFGMYSTFAQEVITNASVIQMKELGFETSTIITKINSSDVQFDASIEELSKLKQAGISPEVISLILQKSANDTKSKTGIYYVDAGGEEKLIQPSVFSGTNSNAAAQRLVSGFINAKKKAQLPKTKSNNVIASGTPEFIFSFDPNTSADNMQTNQGNQAGFLNWWFRTATSPNEFVLVQLTVKERKNLREVVTGKSNWLTDSNGIDPKYALDFSIEELPGNKFKVVPNGLEPGEYCFIYQGQVPQGRDNQSVFDFSIE